jgi:hypothetical protein
MLHLRAFLADMFVKDGTYPEFWRGGLGRFAVRVRLSLKPDDKQPACGRS